jgi:hypothetical protein
VNGKKILCLIVLCALVIAALVWLLVLRSSPLKLPNTISTVAKGYPYAIKLKNAVAPQAYLSGVLVDLDCSNNTFETESISYGFRIPNDKRTIIVLVDNISRTAYSAAAEDPIRFPVPESVQFQKFDLSQIPTDVSNVLSIAESSGLSEFCRIVPAHARNIYLRLGGSGSGITWSVVGDGWDQKGPIADLHIEINATNGVVIRHSLDKAVGRS